MRNLFLRLWNDEGGFIVTIELILIATVLVIGLVSGMALLRDAVLGELEDVASSIGALNQGLAIAGQQYTDAGGCANASAGSLWDDAIEASTDTATATDEAVGGGLIVCADGVDEATSAVQ